MNGITVWAQMDISATEFGKHHIMAALMVRINELKERVPGRQYSINHAKVEIDDGNQMVLVRKETVARMLDWADWTARFVEGAADLATCRDSDERLKFLEELGKMKGTLVKVKQDLKEELDGKTGEADTGV